MDSSRSVILSAARWTIALSFAIATHLSAKAVELSALREDELDPLLGLLSNLDANLKFSIPLGGLLACYVKMRTPIVF